MAIRTRVLGEAEGAALVLFLIAVLAGLLTGCASTARYPTPERQVTEPARIRNLSLSGVRVYVEHGGQTQLLGSVPPLSSARLSLPAGMARRGTRLGLLVAPIAGRVAGEMRMGQRILVADVLVDELTSRGWTVLDSSF